MLDVLHINSYYESSVFYKGLYEKQKEHGLNLKVYVPSSGFKGLDFEYGEYTCLSYCFKELDRVFFHLKHNKILKDIKGKYDFKNVKLLHAHSLFSNGYVAYRLKKEYGIPYIVAVRNADVNTFFPKMIHLRKMAINILKEAEKIVFISESYRQVLREKYIPKDYREEFDKKAIVIPNGVNQFYIDHCGEPKKLNANDKLKFLYVGEINQNKNVEFVAKTLETTNSTLSIVGKISDQKVYDNIKDLQCVKYYPPKQKEELIEVFREHDIFVMPSITETFGLVYVEAMSQGTPVIYTRGQGFDKQFPDGVVGYPMKHDSKEEFEDVVNKITENYEEMSCNCIEGCKAFSWDKISNVYNEIYVNINRDSTL